MSRVAITSRQPRKKGCRILLWKSQVGNSRSKQSVSALGIEGLEQWDGSERPDEKVIKKAGQRCYGLVYLDVSQRSVDPASFWNDSLPNEFVTIQLEVQRCLDRFNTSVSAVILLGKDHNQWENLWSARSSPFPSIPKLLILPQESERVAT